MSQEKTNEENIPFYQYSEFQNVKLITANIFKARFRISQKTVALKCVSSNDEFTLDNLMNEIKRYRKLEIHDGILKFYGITKQENANDYRIILEYVNEGSLRQYLKTNFQSLDWNAKINLAKQIANVLMFLHSNDIIHGKFNSENILIHNGIIKLNVFGLIKITSSFLINNLGPIQHMDPQNLELFNRICKNKSSDIFCLGIILWEISSGNPPFEMESSSNVGLLNYIVKEKREMAIPGTPHKYKEIYTDCWRHGGNSRSDISQVFKNLSEIIIPDASVEFETPQSQPYNVTDVKLENINIQKEEPEIKPDSPFFDITTEVNVFIKDLFEFFIDLFNRQPRIIRAITIKNYIREHKRNPVEILYQMTSHPSYYWFTSLIGFFYQYGIGTVADNQMALKFFNLAAIQIIDNSPLRNLYNINKEIGIICLAYMYVYGLGIEKDTSKAFQIWNKLADKGSLMALNSLAYCYIDGVGVEKNEKKAFEIYSKSAEKGFLDSQLNVCTCYQHGTGITKDEAKGFQWAIKSALSGNVRAIHDVGWCYYSGRGVFKDKKEAIKWYLKAAEREYNVSQHNLGCCYRYGDGIDRDSKEAFKWFKKAAENNYADGQLMIGKCFYLGCGTKKDIVNAIYWLNKAKANGNTYANVILERIIMIR
ncbi:hypothetical protein Glove_52g40 [Diversispora epigaea]|uniref:Protein kinase domain-containing protein n=1 Tax=Diversispora epigaea TaxID=1348612 RepID=A0A397JM82_9GLOM|nr:hypothetical protein Glove_52g40 [Diversispora epigaea]